MRSLEMLTWGLAVLVFCKIIVHAQIIHSVDRMSEAIQSKAQLKGHMKEYIIAERKRLDELEKSLDAQEVSSQYENLTKKELEVAMSHPVRVFRFMNQMSYEVDSLTFGVNRQVVSYEFNKTLARLPKRKDFVDAANALSRLQQIYGEEADFTRPTADNTDNVLTAAEVMEIANICLDGKSLACAMNNFRRAREMFAEIGDRTQSMIAYDFLAYVTHQQGNVEHALNYTLELRDHYHTAEGDNEETLDRLNENVRLYINELGGDEMVAKNNVKELVKPEENYDSHDYPAYNALCRGEAIEVPAKETRQLMCHHYTNNNHPLLIISPAKQEEIHLDTGLSFFHHVLTDGETELLQRLASQKFEDSAMVADDAIEKDPTIEVTEDKAFSDQRVRSSNTGWVDDYESETIRDLSNRIGAILGLTTRSAEAFQVLSYGIGGFYLPHFDWGYEDQPFIGFDGNRIATWIFYLNDIKKGGATVFPDIGATVWPEKGGAAFWRNLHRNGTGNPLTLHAACPVLEGYKWASNKWFHTGGNEFSWPCGTDKDM